MPILHSSCSVLSAVLESLVIPVKSTFRAELEMLGLWLTNYVYTSVNFLMSWNLISITLMKWGPSWPSDQEQNAWVPFPATRKFAGLFLKTTTTTTTKNPYLVEELVIDLALQHGFCMLGTVTVLYPARTTVHENIWVHSFIFVCRALPQEVVLSVFHLFFFFYLELLTSSPPGKYKSDIFLMNLIWKLALGAEQALKVILLLILWL